MTLKEFFEFITSEPVWIITYLLLIPFTALLAMFLGKGEGHESPWKYLYSTLVYMICIPGVLAVGLNVYQFIFGSRDLMQADIFTQIFPIISMILTLILIKKNTPLDGIPGFDKISGLMFMIAAVISVMWIVDRTRIIIFSYLPVQYALLIMVGLLLVFRFGMKKLFN